MVKYPPRWKRCLTASDRVRWSVFGDERLYLLNTEEHLAQEAVVRLSPDAAEIRVTFAPGEIRELSLCGE